MSVLVKMDHRAPQQRAYRMGLRAENVAETRERIVGAAIDLFMARYIDEISLRDVARHAGVALQTLVRHVGSRDGLIQAVAAVLHAQVLARRAEAPIGDIQSAIGILVDHYEANGRRLLHALAQEDRLASLHAALDAGRRVHHRWLETVFEPFLPRLAAERRLRLAQLAAVTDVYAWKVLRLDLGLERARAEAVLLDLARIIVERGK
jgi:AcrR family transcriptional regulator